MGQEAEVRRREAEEERKRLEAEALRREAEDERKRREAEALRQQLAEEEMRRQEMQGDIARNINILLDAAAAPEALGGGGGRSKAVDVSGCNLLLKQEHEVTSDNRHKKCNHMSLRQDGQALAQAHVR